VNCLQACPPKDQVCKTISEYRNASSSICRNWFVKAARKGYDDERGLRCSCDFEIAAERALKYLLLLLFELLKSLAWYLSGSRINF
jgi:hypothetical protein